MDRKALLAVLLMMVIAIVPSFFLERPAPSTAPVGEMVGPARSPAGADPTPPPGVAPPAGLGAAAVGADGAGTDTVLVRGELYRLAIATRGGRLLQATLPRYRSTIPALREAPLTLLPRDSSMLGGFVVAGADTISLDAVRFAPSATDLNVAAGERRLALVGDAGGRLIRLTYDFEPADYRFRVELEVAGIPVTGGLYFIPLGAGLANTEADSAANFAAGAYVTQGADGTTRHDFSGLKAGRTAVHSGPFDWVAVKSKYFVAALFAGDTAVASRMGGVTAEVPSGVDEVRRAAVTATLPVPATGRVRYEVYAGPLEYERLKAIGRDFDDVNPYGFPGFRTVIRFFAVPVRALMVWMHTQLDLGYGLVLVAFGILVRIVLWPLNQKAMRASLAMQALQGPMEEIKRRYAKDPQRQQQEIFKLYKEHNVNPLGGCWPMLLPMPVLFALFFVLQGAIELRGTSFLWMPDLSRADPTYIVPLVMGASMWGLYKVGQVGVPPNPQQKLMTWMMPVMMTVIFLNFASGLNLYYAVSNIASIPQQWLLARERLKRGGTARK